MSLLSSFPTQNREFHSSAVPQTSEQFTLITSRPHNRHMTQNTYFFAYLLLCKNRSFYHLFTRSPHITEFISFVLLFTPCPRLPSGLWLHFSTSFLGSCAFYCLKLLSNCHAMQYIQIHTPVQVNYLVINHLNFASFFFESIIFEILHSVAVAAECLSFCIVFFLLLLLHFITVQLKRTRTTTMTTTTTTIVRSGNVQS